MTGIINLKYICIVEQAGFAQSLKDELGIALLCAMYKHRWFFLVLLYLRQGKNSWL